MQKQINERLDIFVSVFTDLIKGFVDEIDGRPYREKDLIDQIPESEKRYFLINDENFDEVIVEVVETLKYNLDQSGQNINVARAFKSFFKSFKDLIVSNKEITNQINDSYKAFSINNQAMQIEEASESEKDIEFDDEVEFSKVYSNKPRGFINTKGDNNIEVNSIPISYGFNCLYVDPVESRQAIIDHLKFIESKFSRFLSEKGYYETNGDSLIKDVYRIGRVIFYDAKIQADDYKNVVFEQLNGDKLRTVHVSFEHINDQIVYSGQCILIRTSTNNTKIDVKEIIAEVPKGYGSEINKIEEEKVTPHSSDCNVVVVKGPFFNPDRYDFSLVISKLKACLSKSNANVLIVKGPIVSQNYKKPTNMSYEDAKNKFISMLNDLPCSNVVYVNEVSEKTNISLLPTNPLESFGRIIQAPNPCTITIGGFKLSFTDERLLDEMVFNSLVLDKGNNNKKLDFAIKAIHNSHSLLPVYNMNIYFDWSQYENMLLKSPVDIFFVHSGKFDATVTTINKTQYVNLKSFVKPSCFGSYSAVKLSDTEEVYCELFECDEDADN